ncbi:unnamed protein product [Rhizoctonia solani]|uniref:NACHT domain-containing protein n=1 Tax=Rhizoctonia solani TaxID=456999 RepID=A0A8H3GYI2_9AGAM|nr:unnamed protein product [Rhizoctonia solani]
MDSRKRPKETSERAEGGNKRGKFDFRAFLPSECTLDPSTSYVPPVALLGDGTDEVDLQVQIPMSTNRLSNNLGDSSSHLEYSLRPMEEDRPYTVGSSPSAPDVEPHTLNTSLAKLIDGSISHSTQPSPNVAPDHTERNQTDSAEDSVPEGTPRTAPSATPTMWKNLKGLGKPAILRPVTNLFGPIKEIAEVLVDCVDNYEMVGTAKVEYDELRVRLEVLLEDLKQYFGEGCSPTMTSSMQCLCKSIREELGFIQNKQGRIKGARYLAAKDETNVILACCRRVEGYLKRLLLNANLSIWKIAHDQATESHSNRMFSLIDRLPSSLPARYDSAEGAELKRRECTPGTRVDVLATVLGWVCNKGDGAVYWLNGMAGTGKTTIAYSICAALDSAHTLGASFFCSRLREECRNVNLIIPSIAYQLARFSRPYQSALCTVLERDPDIHRRILHLQFDALIREPMLAVQHTLPEELVIVIDALDECDNKESTRRILEVLLSGATGIPLRFVVSSRPEPEIRDQMTRRTENRLVLHDLDKGKVQADIKTYIREGLAQMGPSEEQIAALADRAGILFIYAATAVRYIGYDNFSRNPKARLCTLLDRSGVQTSKRHKEIDRLYMTILEAALGDPELEQDEQDDMQQVLHTVICARESLTVESISELLQIKDSERVRAALQPLWSVLHVVGVNELVTILHASFPDFMFDPARSKSYHCNSDAHNQALAKHCFELLKRTQPQFNICRIESSYLPDESVSNIEDQVAKAISPELLYACRFWTHHIEAGKCPSALVELLQDFLFTRLLLWMEILNLSKQMKSGMECMKMMVKWCDQFDSHRELVELAHDAERFVQAFSSNPVSRSTPHIYLSMLTFWPRSAPIAKHYAKYTHGPVKAEGPALERRHLVHLATWTFSESINAMAVSPDASWVALATGSDVLVVDLLSGRVVLGPLKGHKSIVISITFSHGGARVIAGSANYNPCSATILGWDTHTGDTVLGPLRLDGHKGYICRVSFSPDCTHIATGSDDNTVRLWDAENGNMLHCLETQDWIYATVFSPGSGEISAQFIQTLQDQDSQTGKTIRGPLADLNPHTIFAFFPGRSRIVCASHDSDYLTIYIRNAQSGDKILGPIGGHRAAINCIGCSPDGKYFVSGSNDRTIRVWDAVNGNLVLGPLEAHTGDITSVAFSPNGSRIISACKGGLVCTWDARQRNLASGSTNALFDRITCVKFSSDGTRFVSGSEVGTICTWDAHTGDMKFGPIKAHTSRIDAIDYLDGFVVSGFKSGNICIFHALTGEAVLGPLEVHPGSAVQAIAYSPDGKYIATGSDNEINFWDAHTGSRVLSPPISLDAYVLSIQFSPDGTRIVGSSVRACVAVWDVSSGENVFGILGGRRDWVYSVSYSPNGNLIAACFNDGAIIIWDAYTGNKALSPLTGHSGSVCSVHFSPDSTRLVSGSSDKTIHIWDVRTGEMLFELLHGHENSIASVAYSPVCGRILSLSDDMSVRIHDARSPEERAISCSESEIGEWALNKDGWVVDDQGRLLVWVPGDLRRSLMLPRTEVIVAPCGFVRLRFEKSHMGESWAQIFTSDP